MSAFWVIGLIVGYFGVLIGISYLTSRNQSNDTFFKANRRSPWFLVAFGMIGASLSGITFISIPGTVGENSFSYFQVVLGYTIGYAVISLVLLPLYYKMNLTSIYEFLKARFGRSAYKTASAFFLLSRIVGAAFRLFLVANVLQLILFDDLNIPYYVTVTVTILLIWIYTFRGGIKTIVWTDSLQTFFMLLSMGITMVIIADEMNIAADQLLTYIGDHEQFKIFFWEDLKSANFFGKQFISGAFIAIVMTGLDQDMMQKNLTCRNLKEAQKNIFWFTITLTLVNFLFLSLGILLYDYAAINGIKETKDALFPAVATSDLMPISVGVFFLLGLIAAAYSSADSALTSMTTSISVDLFEIEQKQSQQKQVHTRKMVHVVVSLTLIAVMMIFRYVIQDESVINKLFKFAGYTYGPLLGMFAYGILLERKVTDKWIPSIAIASPVLSYALDSSLSYFYDFDLGFFVLIVNGVLCFTGLSIISSKASSSSDSKGG